MISGSNKNKIQSKHIYQKPSSIHLSIQIYPSIYSNLSIYPLGFFSHLSTEGLRFIYIYLPRYIFIYLSTQIYIYLSIYLDIYLSIYLPRYIFIYLSDVYYTIHSHFKPNLCPSAEKSSRFLSNYLSIFYPYILITSILLHVSKL